MVAGLAATAVLSIIMIMKGMMGLMPELNVIGILAGMFGMKLGMMAPIMTLMLHAVFGAVLGGVFAKL